MSKKGLLIIFVVGVAAAMMMVWWNRIEFGRRFAMVTDFRAYYTAALLIKNGAGSGFYDLERQLMAQQTFAGDVKNMAWLMPFLNPPVLAFMLVPLATLPFGTAVMVWAVVNGIFLAVLGLAIWNEVGKRTSKAYLIVMGGLFGFYPVLESLRQGQISVLLTIAFLMAWKEWKNGEEKKAGWWLSLLMLRPHLLMWPIVYLVIRRSWRGLAGLTVGVVVASAISLSIVGWGGMVRYGGLLAQVPGWGDALTVHPQLEPTWNGLLRWIFNTNDFFRIRNWWLGGVGIIWTSWLLTAKVKTGEVKERLVWGGMITGVILVSLHSNVHDLTLMLAAAVIALGKKWKETGWLVTGGVCLGVLSIIAGDPRWAAVMLMVLFRLNLVVIQRLSENN